MVYRIIQTQGIFFVFAKQFPEYGVLIFFIYMNVIICFFRVFQEPFLYNSLFYIKYGLLQIIEAFLT